ncbi:MAG: MerR family transcriptional regulator [Gammaproteobacteria bacterium]|nr:MerR family transcriptional regulator [Gammaproteobacteria bacterium]MBT6734705.1 MerR family transcriptional regulator [Gammaproteobacteria bacterium]
MMENQSNNTPVIPNKRYFTIGEVSKICDVKAHVLRYWEQEFKELEPIKRKGNRRYYQQKDLAMILKIKELLQNKGFTIEGAKNMINVDEVKSEPSSSKHMLAQIKSDLENILSILKR